MALFDLNHQGSKAIRDAFIQALQGTDIQVVFQTTVNFGERDFRLWLAKAKKEQPDVYFVFLFSPEMEIFAKQFKELGIPEPLTTMEAFSLSAEPELFEGRWYVDASDMPEDAQEKFHRKYGHKATMAAGNTYDIIKMIVYGYENTPSTNSIPSTEAVAETLSKIKNFQGMLGNLSMDETGIVQSEAVLKEIRNGKPVIVQKDL